MNNTITPIERALIVRRPYSDWILDGTKIWEMRSQKTNIRGRIAIIEGGSGLIKGEVYLSNSGGRLTEREIDIMGMTYHSLHRIDDIKLLKRWPVPWALRDAKRFDTPIPYDHPAGAVIWIDLKKLGIVIP